MIGTYIFLPQVKKSLGSFLVGNEINLFVIVMSGLLTEEIFLVVIMLVICLLAALVIEKHKISWMHESAFSIIVGFVCSWIMSTDLFPHDVNMNFDSELFFTAILPPIIFAAGYTLKKQEFFENFRYILGYGVLGTILAFIIITLFTYGLSSLDFVLSPGEKLSLPDCMLLACILSSTDTVAALTLVKAEQYPKLNSILFGEGIVNDAVSILLFRTVKSHFGTSSDVSFSWGMIGSIALDFTILSVVSVLIGIVFGLFLSYAFKKIQAFSEKPKLETCLILLTGYMSYLTAEKFHFSGIMTLFSCGLVMSHYTMQNLSEESKAGTTLIFDSFGFLGETFVFIYLGMTIFNFDYSYIRWTFAIGILIVVALARLISVFLPPSLYMIGCCGKEIDLTLKEMKVIWYSGLVRGTIAFALAWVVDTPSEQYIRSTTLVVVVTTTMVLTILLEKFAKHIGLTDNVMSELSEIMGMLQPGTLGDETLSRERLMNEMREMHIKPITGDDEDPKTRKSFISTFKRFESKFLQPTFGSSQNNSNM